MILNLHRRQFILRIVALFIFLITLPVFAQESALPSFVPPPAETVPLMLRRLHTTARILHVTAHPDDEDGGMLTLESRGKGASVTLLTLNRGEGGQNKVGSNLFDELGILRTLELLAADRYYGVEQRFTRVADFGFSKSPDETFAKWHGHDVPLDDMVRVIRTFRPDVIVARFQGTARDGHGHHQASAILAREAFRAAADPRRFPEQIAQGLLPWQAKKFYLGNFHADEDPTLALDTGAVDPLLADSYVHIGMNGLRHQLSQGSGSWQVSPGPHFTYYKLIDSALPGYHPAHEQDFMDGIDTSLTGLAARVPEEDQAAFLKPALEKIKHDIDSAQTAVEERAAKASPLVAALSEVEVVVRKIKSSQFSAASKQDLLASLESKREQIQETINLVAGVSARATYPGTAVAIPGERLKYSVAIKNSGHETITPIGYSLKFEGQLVPGNQEIQIRPLAPGESRTQEFLFTIPENASYTRPFFHRRDPVTDSVYEVDPVPNPNAPLPPAALEIAVDYKIGGGTNQVSAPVEATVNSSDGREFSTPTAVAPPFSLLLNPATQVVPLSQKVPTTVVATVSSNRNGPTEAFLKLEAPPNWRVEPPRQQIDFGGRGESRQLQFQVYPDSVTEGTSNVAAVVEYKGKQYSEGYSLVSREDLGAAYYYQPAVQKLSVTGVIVPQDLKVGYIMGAGDDIPAILTEVGVNLRLITPTELASGDLTHYDCLVLGIRAYDTRDDVKRNNQKLLDYVSQGGTLMVQYNASVGDFNAGRFTPFPAELGRERVTVEEAPVEMLHADNPIFQVPNRITQHDFDGWVQERGLYFMSTWDPHFEPLLSSHDPGEGPLQGGLLRAKYGKGLYIYNGYSFFRQLPNGVPGAVRLYVNLLSAGHARSNPK